MLEARASKTKAELYNAAYPCILWLTGAHATERSYTSDNGGDPGGSFRQIACIHPKIRGSESRVPGDFPSCTNSSR